MEDNKTITYYNEHAEEFIENTWKADMSEVYGRFLKYMEPGAHILDAGCGSGRDSYWFMQKGYQVTAADASESMCKAAERLTGQQVVQFRFEDMDYQEAFDGIWACASLLHVKRDKLPEIIGKMMTALREGGVLYASWKYGISERWSDNRYFCDLTQEELSQILSQQGGYVLEECWITEDVRVEHKSEKWLNAIIRKSNRRIE